MAHNCWEFKNCGRERGGSKASELGICPAAHDHRFRGMNDGANGGRICWSIAGTLCGGNVQGTFAQKHKTCLDCEFYKKVSGEQGPAFKMMPHAAIAK